MNGKVLILLTLSMFISLHLFSQNFSTQGIYINDFKNIIGDQNAEDELLQFVQEEGFNYLLLYNMYHIHKDMFDLTTAESALPLSSFIEKAKTQYGINEIGVVGEKLSSFDKIQLYNEAHSENENQQIDVFHIEFEFWNQRMIDNYYCATYLTKNGFDCSKDGAFDYFFEQLTALKDLTKSLGLKSETYVGNPTEEECKLIGLTVDRAMVHYYRKSDYYNNGNSIYNFKKYRLSSLAPDEMVLNVIPVFSSRSYHMGPWLLENAPEQAFETWLFGQNGFEEDSGNWKNHVNVEGFQWYRYTDYKAYLDAANSFQYRLGNNDEVNTVKEEVTLEIFPNPAMEELTIKNLTSTIGKMKILDFSGRVIWQGASLEETRLDVEDWSRGIYFVKTEKNCYKIILQGR